MNPFSRRVALATVIFLVLAEATAPTMVMAQSADSALASVQSDYDNAMQFERDGESAFADGSYGTACSNFRSAQELFGAAAEGARRAARNYVGEVDYQGLLNLAGETDDLTDLARDNAMEACEKAGM